MAYILLKAAKLLNKIPKRQFCSMVILAAGSSVRMGTDKLTADINGRPAIAWTLATMQDCSVIDEIVIVARHDRLDEMSKICKKYGIEKATKVVAGGKTRIESAWLGVNAVSERARYTGIHDGARPLASVDLVKSVIELAKKTGAAVAAIPESDTVRRAELGVLTEQIDRRGIFKIQTPQVFASEIVRAAIFAALEKGDDFTDDSAAVQAMGMNVHIAPGSAKNIKLTTAEDLDIARALLGGRLC